MEGTFAACVKVAKSDMWIKNLKLGTWFPSSEGFYILKESFYLYLKATGGTSQFFKVEKECFAEFRFIDFYNDFTDLCSYCGSLALYG